MNGGLKLNLEECCDHRAAIRVPRPGTEARPERETPERYILGKAVCAALLPGPWIPVRSGVSRWRAPLQHGRDRCGGAVHRKPDAPARCARAGLWSRAVR